MEMNASGQGDHSRIGLGSAGEERMTLEDAKDLLGASMIPGSPEEVEVFLHWTERLIQRKGEDYVRRYRRRLFRQWESLLRLGLSRI
jgi:hypothetical protein